MKVTRSSDIFKTIYIIVVIIYCYLKRENNKVLK